MSSSPKTGKDVMYEEDNGLYEEYITNDGTNDDLHQKKEQSNRKSFLKNQTEKKWWILVILWLLSIIVVSLLTVYSAVYTFLPKDIIEENFQIDAFNPYP